MARRLALLFDRNSAFTSRLQRVLREAGCDSRLVTSRKSLLKSVKDDNPSIVFLAVEQPRKTGFSLFSDVRLSCRHVPVVLMTGSVPPEEMRIHQTLQVHADAYLDKRTANSLDLLKTVNQLLHLELSDQDLELLARKSRLFPPGTSPSSEDSLETEIEHRISWDDGQGVPSMESTSPDGEYDEEFIQRPAADGEPQDVEGSSETTDSAKNRALKAEVEQLKQELEEMHCAVRSTPFSEEYRSLKSRAVKSEEEARSLREQLSGQVQRVHDLESKLVDAEFQVRSQRDSEAMAQDQVRSLEQQIAQSVEERVSTEHEWAQSMEKLKARCEREKAEATERASAEARREIEAFQRKQAEALESTTNRTREEVAEAVKANDASWQARLAELSREHESALESERAEHQKEVSRIISEQARKLLEKEEELKGAMMRAATAHEEELAARDKEWKERLAKAREEFEVGRSADCSALEARYRKELQVLRSQHIKERERLQKMHAEGLDSLSAKLRHTYQDPETIKNPLLRSKVEKKLKEREAELAAQMEEAGKKS